MKAVEKEEGGQQQRLSNYLYWICAALLVAMALYSRFQAPQMLEVLNDETIHLQSFRNHYSSNKDVYPIFLKKLSLSKINPKTKDLLSRFYNTGALAQRVLIIGVDGHPPAFPVSAELIEMFSGSSLIAVRTLSVISSLLFIFCLYRLGLLLYDRSLGLWLAALGTWSPINIVFSGIARPYALGQLALALALLMYVNYGLLDPRSKPGRFLLSCLIAQSVHWVLWLLILPMVLEVAIRRLRTLGFRSALLESWWYVLISVLLLLEAFIQTKNPALSQHLTFHNWAEVLHEFAVGEPFAILANLMPYGLELGLALLVVLVIAGVIALFRLEPGGVNRLALTGTLLLSVLTPFYLMERQFMTLYMVAPTLFAALALRAGLKSQRLALIVLSVVLAFTAGWLVKFPVNPYAYIITEPKYSPIARVLKTNMQASDSWIAYPYFLADCLFNYGPFPQPLQPLTENEIEDSIRQQAPTHREVFLLTLQGLAPPSAIRNSMHRWSFPNHIELYAIPGLATK